jgi:hypothetical protein
LRWIRPSGRSSGLETLCSWPCEVRRRANLSGSPLLPPPFLPLLYLHDMIKVLVRASTDMHYTFQIRRGTSEHMVLGRGPSVHHPEFWTSLKCLSLILLAPRANNMLFATQTYTKSWLGAMYRRWLSCHVVRGMKSSYLISVSTSL